jgi:hypothetical protein
MTNSHSVAPGGPAPEPPRREHSEPRPRSTWDRLSLIVQFTLSIGIAVGALVYLMWSGAHAHPEDEGKRPAPPEEVVQEAGPMLIRIKPGTPLDARLQVAVVQAAWLRAPVLPVTGTCQASLRTEPQLPAGAVGLAVSPLGPNPFAAACHLATGGSNDAWQFATPDLLNAFSDWQKAVVDVQFQRNQLASIKEAAEFRVTAQKEVVERMENLVKAGTHTLKDLVAERVNLKTFEIQGKREVHEAENALKVARKTETTLARQLQQAGLEPTLLRHAALEGEVVVAEVPERAVSRVKLGMTCAVKFFAVPDRVFVGKVSAIAPVVTKEKRVLNVQFTVRDPEYLVRPGMFAEIGLGTDARERPLMPADGVLHVENKDYALVQVKKETWKVTEVQVGEARPGFTLTEESFAAHRAAKVPDRVLSKLFGLKDQVFETPEQLWERVAAALTKEEQKTHQNLVASKVQRGMYVEVLAGVKDGDVVLGKGAILLKPVVVRALQAAEPGPAVVASADLQGGQRP